MARLAILPTRFGGVGAWHAQRNSAVFFVAEIVAAKMLLFFRKSATLVVIAAKAAIQVAQKSLE